MTPGPVARPPRPGRRAPWLALALLLAGCSSLPPPVLPGPLLSGRLLLRIDALDTQPARAVSSSFELRGDEHDGELLLISPLGTQLARARWQAGSVVLDTPEGRRQFDDLGALAREALGKEVPLAALTHWLAGRPWPGAPATANDRGFAQLGWQVDVTRLADDGALEARRDQPAPALTVRARLDR